MLSILFDCFNAMQTKIKQQPRGLSDDWCLNLMAFRCYWLDLFLTIFTISHRNNELKTYINIVISFCKLTQTIKRLIKKDVVCLCLLAHSTFSCDTLFLHNKAQRILFISLNAAPRHHYALQPARRFNAKKKSLLATSKQ